MVSQYNAWPCPACGARVTDLARPEELIPEHRVCERCWKAARDAVQAAAERGIGMHHYHVLECSGMGDPNGHAIRNHHRVSPPMTVGEAAAYLHAHPAHFESEGPYRYTTTTECRAQGCPTEWRYE